MVFEIDLMSVEQPGQYNKQIWTMSEDEKYALVVELREKGRNL